MSKKSKQNNQAKSEASAAFEELVGQVGPIEAPSQVEMAEKDGSLKLELSPELTPQQRSSRPRKFNFRLATPEEIKAAEGKEYGPVANLFSSIFVLRLTALDAEGEAVASFGLKFAQNDDGSYGLPKALVHRDNSQYQAGKKACVDALRAIGKKAETEVYDRAAKKRVTVAVPAEVAAAVEFALEAADRDARVRDMSFTEFSLLSGRLWDDVLSFCREKRDEIAYLFDTQAAKKAERANS